MMAAAEVMSLLGLCRVLVISFVFHKTFAVTPDFQDIFSTILSPLGGGSGPPTPVYVPPVQPQQYSNEWGTGLCEELCRCGVPNRSTRIIGGHPADVNEYPWVVALSKRGKIVCGGTLITDLHVLTAAHCVQGNIFVVRMQLTIILAEHDLTTSEESPTETRRIASLARHRDFRPLRGNFNGDIAIIRMSAPVKFSQHLAPACLPSPGLDFAGSKGTVAGWGRLSENGKIAPVLHAVDVPIHSNDFCLTNSVYQPDKVTDRMMCAGRIQGGADSCQGDSGGALLVIDPYKRMVAAGIVSWGEGCARAYRPGVYTRVNYYLPWIQENTKEGCFCA